MSIHELHCLTVSHRRHGFIILDLYIDISSSCSGGMLRARSIALDISAVIACKPSVLENKSLLDSCYDTHLCPCRWPMPSTSCLATAPDKLNLQIKFRDLSNAQGFQVALDRSPLLCVCFSTGVSFRNMPHLRGTPSFILYAYSRWTTIPFFKSLRYSWE